MLVYLRCVLLQRGICIQKKVLEELQKHPSHKNVNAFILAKKLCESRSMDKMAFADEGGGENAKQREYAKQRLKTMFRGYRLKTRGSAGANQFEIQWNLWKSNDNTKIPGYLSSIRFTCSNVNTIPGKTVLPSCTRSCTYVCYLRRY